MHAMILAAGVGSRLRPLTNVCPKPMLPIAGRPLIEHTLDWLYRYGVRDVTMNLHHLPEVITEALGAGGRFGLRVTYSYEGQLRGTAGAIRQMGARSTEAFVLVHGDLLVDIDLAGLVAAHRRRGAQMTLACRRASVPQARDLVATDRWGRVTGLGESVDAWGSGLVSAGVYIIEPQVVAAIPEGVHYDIIGDLLPQLIAAGAPVYAHEAWGYLTDINSHASYARAQEDWALSERALGV